MPLRYRAIFFTIVPISIRYGQGVVLVFALGGEGELASAHPRRNSVALSATRTPWAKPDALLICGVCYEDGEGDIRVMLAESDTANDAARPVLCGTMSS